MVALALVDGPSGLGRILDHGTEYLQSARAIDDVGAMLRDYVARIPLDSPGNWPVHLAGHPPGCRADVHRARPGRAGVVAGSRSGRRGPSRPPCPPPSPTTLDRLGARARGSAGTPLPRHRPRRHPHGGLRGCRLRRNRRMGCCSPRWLRPRQRARGGRYALAVRAGLLFGWCLMESYGLVLLGAVAVAVLLSANGAAARSWAGGRGRREPPRQGWSSGLRRAWASPGGRRIPHCRNATGPAWPASGPGGTGWWATSRPWCWWPVRCCRPPWEPEDRT